MKNSSLYIIVLLLLSFAFAMACNSTSTAPQEKQLSVTGKVYALNNVPTDLPEKPGYKTFYSNCVVCHSPRYIQDQPDMPEKTWTAIVTKMQKTFGAPVSDSSAKIIIQYLVSIKGTKEGV